MAAEGGGAKYINSPETPLFRKSELLYGYHLAKGAIRLAEEMVLVEGNFDVVQLHQAGQATAVAPLGTALTAEHLKLAKRLAQKIFLAFDGDSAGAKATLASLELAENEGLDVRVIVLPPGNDPDSLIRNEPERWPKLKENALPVIEYRIRQILGAEDLNASVGKTRAADAAMALIRRLSSDVSRAHYVEKVASALHIPQDVLLQQLRRGGAPQRQSAGHRQPAGQRQPVSTQPVWPPTEFELIKLLLRTPHLIDRLGEVNADWLTHPDVAEIVASLRDLTAKNFQYDGFYASVTPEQRQVISTVAFSQEADDYADADPAVDFEAICRRLEVRYLEQYLRQLREQTASAERDGDDQRLAGLQLEQSQLVIKLHQLREYS
jgi:DNA primase